jgi:H+/gluconate symporter-like permease
MLSQFIQWLKETSNTPKHLVRSYLFLRKCVGVIGIALPIVLIFGTMILEWHPGILDSISAYYYSATRNIFVGSLCAIAIFLICYRYEHLDDFVSTVAGASAIGVALFPTTPDKATGQQMMIGILHGLFAGIFFGTLAIFALWIFRKTDQKKSKLTPNSQHKNANVTMEIYDNRTPRKKQRDIVYLICGLTIVICLVLLILIALVQNLFLSGKPWLQPLPVVLVLESLAIWAFGIAWFVKGETILKDPPEEADMRQSR